ncbi:MAG: hypothetical protein J6K45_01170 [Clostridia bacterium]|nr:hypothetical protein [Clostridia bacterium]
MENAVDALKMAGAALLFILAFSVAMYLLARARQTTDAVLDNLKLEEFLPKVEALENNVTREVGIETVIPTLYRYAQSDANIRIRILKKDGTEHQVFDQNLDSDVATAVSINPGSSNDNAYYTRLRSEYNNPTKSAYLFEAPWRNQNDSSYRIDRINAYIYGTQMKHLPEVSYVGKGLLDLIESVTPGSTAIFEESYLEYNISGTVEKDEYGEEIVTRPPSTKTIITYKLK